MTRLPRACGHLISAVALLFSTAVAAQAQPSNPPVLAPDASSVSIAPVADVAPSSEIVVTARRREETLVSVPVVVSVQTAADLVRNNATDLSRIAELTPTVIVGNFKSNAGGSIAIRGISSPANQTGFEQSVSVAIDGVQTSDGRVSQLGFFDIQQVEVLKGPQALFFGKNSPAGVISIKTANPARSPELTLRGGYEFVGDEYTLEAAASHPLGDNFGVRIAARYRNLDGWLRNTAQPIANPFYRAATGAPAAAAFLPGTSNPRPGDSEILGRLTLAGKLGTNLTVRLKMFAARSIDEGAGVQSQNIGPCTGPNPRMFGIPDPAADCRPDRNTTAGDVPPIIAQTIRRAPADGRAKGELTVYTASLDVGLDLGAVSLASISGFNKTKYDWFSGFDQTSFSQLAFTNLQQNEEVSQEVRLTSDFESPVNFVVGAFGQKTTLDDTNDVKINDGSYNALANRYVTYNDLNTQRGSTISAFGQVLFKISDVLEAAGGVRFTREKKRYTKRNLYGIGNFNTLATVYPGSDEIGVLKGRFVDENFSPEATITYRPTSTRTLFVAYKTGYKSGGFGLTNPLQRGTRIADVDFKSEKAAGFEVGAKGVFMRGQLRLNAAAFAYKFSNLQVNTYDPAVIAYTINNAGSVRQRGFEFDGKWQASEFFQLRGAIAYVNGRFRNFVGQCYAYAFPTGTVRATATPPRNCSFVNATALTLQQDFGGRAPARSPDWSGNAGVTFDVPLADYKLQLTGDTFYSDAYFAAETMGPSTRQDSFFRFNASVSLTSANERNSIRLVGRNLTNKYYLLYAADRTGGASVPGAIGEQRGVVSRGREIALQLSAKF